MLSTIRTTFPKGLKVNVPCYHMDHFNGKNLELTPEGQQLEVDFARFNALSIANATAIYRNGWEIRGLISVESWPFAHALHAASMDGNTHRFGSVFNDVWYQAAPIDPRFTLSA
ncbi:hypothetical protein [Deinococcus sp. QL22]|uniref:hypothetical protein n=1 Tax=Deinococcus sp. QL22 TaxID=2939437 RepID=UPI00201828F6|nr:hypothetical protein [Deinococcus sp. QL22]UQN08643.1 hypothetical protein M1R55_21180 [Deinococcus sp. QL22]